MADTQLSIVKALRPYRRFERDYDTRSGLIPVSFSDSINPVDPGLTADPYAFDNKGQIIPGIGHRMISMTSVPMGSTVLALIPVVPGVVTDANYLGGNWQYVWRFVFRIRNMGDYNRDKRPYHLGKSVFGVPDTSVYPAPYDTNPQRTIIPGVSDTVVYTRPEYDATGQAAIVTNGSLMEQQQIRPEAYCMSAVARVASTIGELATDLNQGMIPQPPLIPDRETPAIPSSIFGDVQQGIIDPNGTFTDAANMVFKCPQYYPVHVKALGDEMAIWCYKFELSKPGGGYPIGRDWDFDPIADHLSFVDTGAEDYIFSYMFGAGAVAVTDPVDLTGAVATHPNSDCGVYICYGKEGI